MNKERLKEIFKENSSVYFLTSQGEILELEYDRAKYFHIDEDRMIFSFTGGPLNIEARIENLFETEEQAEWYRKFRNMKRVEYFSPLHYDDIDKDYCYDYWFCSKNRNEYLIRVSGRDIILFWVNCDYKEYFKNTKKEYDKLIARCEKLFVGDDI